VEVPRAEGDASSEGDLEQIGGGAGEDRVAQAEPSRSLEQFTVRRTEQVPGRP
jgi:hypothetical protein